MSLYDLVKNSDDKISVYRSFISNAARKKRDLCSATIELSPVCNFTCPFCYARKTKAEIAECGEHIRSFEEWKRIIDELSEIGTSSLTFTGGECMLYPDFSKVYRYAYEKRFGISLLTNCSMLTDEIFDMLVECPPSGIFATMYGASPETYEKVCGNGAYYEIVRKNLKRIADRGINLIVQFTANPDNIDDMVSIGKYAKEIGAHFQHTMDLVNFRRCNTEVVEENTVDREKYLSSADEVFEFSFFKEGFDERIKRERIVPETNLPIIEKGVPCGAGRTSCDFLYNGIMQPCVNFEAIKIETDGRKISDCWSELVAKCDEVKTLTECTNCIHKMKCRHCIAVHYNDTKEFGKPSPRLCYKKLYPERAKYIEDFFNENGYILPEMEKII